MGCTVPTLYAPAQHLMPRLLLLETNLFMPKQKLRQTFNVSQKIMLDLARYSQAENVYPEEQTQFDIQGTVQSTPEGISVSPSATPN